LGDISDTAKAQKSAISYQFSYLAFRLSKSRYRHSLAGPL